MDIGQENPIAPAPRVTCKGLPLKLEIRAGCSHIGAVLRLSRCRIRRSELFSDRPVWGTQVRRQSVCRRAFGRSVIKLYPASSGRAVDRTVRFRATRRRDIVRPARLKEDDPLRTSPNPPGYGALKVVERRRDTVPRSKSESTKSSALQHPGRER